ncbi:hypothetical protein [Microbacterium sp.]|uniref:hypothetical protein n=1 Tax=Microbacterium sp. TaxID=51671 RepID=UPI003C77AE31
MFWSWHVAALIGVVVLVGVAILAFGAAAVKARRTDNPSPVVSLTLSVSAFVAGVYVLGAIITGLSTALASGVTITVPVQTFWPELPAGMYLEGTSATLAGGGFASAELYIEGLSPLTRTLWTASRVLTLLVPAAIAALIAYACWLLLGGRPFAAALAKVTFATALVVLIGGTAMQLLGDIAGGAAAQEVLAWTSGGYAEVAGITDPAAAWWPRPGHDVQLPLWPIGAALGLAALAALFRYGAGLQRETEGLV